MIELTLINSTSRKAPNEKFFRKILDVCVKETKLGAKNIELGINLVGERKILSLNRKFRNKNKPTDVLSFPLDDKEFEKLGLKGLGDIFICLPIAKKFAKRDNISTEGKIARLTVHGFLHLIGHDHERSPREEQVMAALEDKILRKIRF